MAQVTGRPSLDEQGRTAIPMLFRAAPPDAEAFQAAAERRGFKTFSAYVRHVLRQDVAMLNGEETAA